MIRALLGALVVLCACGQPVPVMQPVCEDPALGQPLEIAAGGHATLASTQVTAFEVLDAPGLRATQLDATRWDLRAPYEPLETTVTVRMQCGKYLGEQSFTVKTRAAKWSSLAKWDDPSADGPPNREYGTFWQDGERLLLYGGFHYRPMQFTASHDLWSFDLATSKWSELQQQGTVPQFMGGRVATVPGTRQVLFTGGVDAQFQPGYHLDRFDAETLTWTSQAATGAHAFGDYQPAFVYDSKRGRYLSVCGQGVSLHCDVSELTVPADGPAAWRDLVVDGVQPPGRSGHFFAYDEATDRIIIFGGMISTMGDITGDTWALELEPLRWVKLAEDDAKLKRRNGAYALDVKNHRFVIWGGTPDGRNASAGISFLDLDRGHEAWTTIASEPPPRASGAAVYDAAHGRLIMGLGNSSAGLFPDLWTFTP